jgi:hypothetical protein
VAIQLRRPNAAPKWLLILLSAGSIGVCSALAQNSIDEKPGAPVLALEVQGQTGGWLRNNRISAHWMVLPSGHLGSLEIREQQPDEASERSLVLDAPFSIEFKQTGVLRASDLLVTGPAGVEKLQADAFTQIGRSRCARTRATFASSSRSPLAAGRFRSPAWS